MCELGFAGIVIPETHGGLGLGYTELGLVLEECGRTLVAQPLISSVLLGAGLLLEAGSDQQKQALLPGVAEGSRILAVAFEEHRRFAPYLVKTRAEVRGDGFVLRGKKTFVLDGHVAHTLIVSARTGASGPDDARSGISIFVVDAACPGITLERVSTIDSRNCASVSFDGVALPKESLLGELGCGANALDPALDRATIGLCAELLGLCSEAYAVTLEYLRTRRQFEVTLGSFQALQHRAVDMFCELELCKSVVLDALHAADQQRDDLALTASAAKARLCDASRKITREAIQLHGGIGMTDEHDIGFYLKRGAVAELCFGDSSYHRDRYARLKGF